MKTIRLDSVRLADYRQAEDEIQFVPARIGPFHTPNTYNPSKDQKIMNDIINHPYFGSALLPEERSLTRRMWTLGLIGLNPDAETEADWDAAKLENARNTAKDRYWARKDSSV